MAGNQPRQLTKPYPEPGAPCHHGDITNHTIGQYCVICTRMKMPWGGFLPVARYQGLPVSIGRTGTILQAVQVDNPREIGLVAMATWAIVTNQWHNAVQMNASIERGRIQAAAHAITDIAYLVAQKHGFAEVKWWDVLHEALKNPELTVAAYKTRIRGPAAVSTNSKIKSESSRAVIVAEADEGEEQEDEDLGYDDTDKIPDGEKLLFFSRDGVDVDDEFDAMDSKTERKISPWQFAHGQDLDPAYWATPDTSKFFMVRQLRHNPNKINVREYPHIAGFDWNDKEAVQALNRGRNQIILRTIGPKAPPRLPWSQKERDLLRHQVILGLNHGYTKNNMPWEQVAHNINVDLEKVTQRKGSLLARPSKWNTRTNQEDFYMKRYLTMQKSRTGSDRNATGCMNQSTKFGDIDALLRNSVEHSSRRKPLNDMIKLVSENQHVPAVPHVCAAPSATQGGKIQMKDGEGSSGDEPSSAQSDRIQNNGADTSSDDEPLMKRRQSYHTANKSSGNEPPFTKRRKSDMVNKLKK
ncbi:hypothetical protein SBOR_1775 [Sclerotinia borealis F-4128]|uniref:Uncharacterized protein n=1 Tax=Sclerotinia borealis (strain F-4128) TaxID=1432307 RepID=W9CTM9_SCLBF|nr:hypothetical protein SBOR_1775 [Sclerotinia borealis F-4128]